MITRLLDCWAIVIWNLYEQKQLQQLFISGHYMDVLLGAKCEHVPKDLHNVIKFVYI